jgi:S-DNA-T family DNA segregation ATPase FtsK/SpoIIIE
MTKKTNQRILEFQSDRIEAVLAQHKLAVRVTGGFVSPRWIQFQILPRMGVRVNKIKGLAEELALELSVPTCRVSRQDGLVTVEIPRDDPQVVRLMALQHRLTNIPFGTAVLGLAEDGVPLLLRLPSPQVAHVLIAGTTGSGKSVLAQAVIASLVLNNRPSQISFMLIDPKRRAFGLLAGLPHLLRPVLSEPDEIDNALLSAVELMLIRDREGRMPASDKCSGEPRVVVVIDELADLLMMTETAGNSLTRLVQRGRAAGIHVVACTQKPASAIVGSLAKANFPVRLVGRVTSPEDAKVATGYAGTGAERLVGPGDFIAIAGGTISRFQGAYISPVELAETVTDLRGNGHAPVIPLPAVVHEPSIDVKLMQQIEQARATWRKWRADDGGLKRGGHIRVCKAVFGDDAIDAGHQYRRTDTVVNALEAEIIEEIPTTTPPQTLKLRDKRTDRVCERVVVEFDRRDRRRWWMVTE